jgi:hypothetical protein
MEHILKELALFHAISYHVLQAEGPLEKFAQKCPWVENGGRLGQFMTEDETVRLTLYHEANIQAHIN